jgi:hypothetical protein
MFLAAAKLGEKGIAFSFCMLFYTLLVNVVWWYTIMRELIWITKAFHNILVNPALLTS